MKLSLISKSARIMEVFLKSICPVHIKKTKSIKNKKFNKLNLSPKLHYYLLVPTPGLEPGRPFGQGILSPLRLPIPPSGL